MDATASNSSSIANDRAGRRPFYVAASLALIYAFLAGLRTLGDFDTFWQMATGRWIVQHHHIPSVDVLSYTANGQPWIYPVGAGLLFYWAFLLGGFKLLSWIGATACTGTVALLLRRGSAVSAVLAILAVPLIAERTPPRADMLSVLLFAAFLSLLWQYHRTGHSALWLLPPLMIVWVNVHFGFAAGLGLVLAYLGAEVLEVISGTERRTAAVERLRQAWPWLGLTAVATLINPWGWRLYQALMLQERANSQQQLWIIEWRGLRLNWASAHAALVTGGPKAALYILLAVAMIAAGVALTQKQWGAAALLMAACYPPVQHTRMGAIFACVVVVVAGPVLCDAWDHVTGEIISPRARWVLSAVALGLVVMLVWERSVDLVTNRYYFGSTPQISTFGSGLSWWFPQRAAEFIQQQHLPGQVFNSYDEGGYVTWQLGPSRLDYIDGRDTLFGRALVDRSHMLLQSSLDSATWQQESDRYSINVILLSRGSGIEHGRLKDFCGSSKWRPVYLDTVSAVFVRRSAETEDVIHRHPLDCAMEPVSPPVSGSTRSEQYVASFNAAAVLTALGRNDEATEASNRAQTLFPGSSNAHLLRAGALAALGQREEAEREFRTAISISPSEITWLALASFYVQQDRSSEAIAAAQRAAELQEHPASIYLELGAYALSAGHPEDALEALAKGAGSATSAELEESGEQSVRYRIASGRAEAYKQIGDFAKAASFQEQAVQLAPDLREAWTSLAQIYQMAGRFEDSERTRQRAAALPERKAQH